MNLIADGTRILCLSPHPDDVEFGLGATLDKFKGAYEGLLVVFSDRSATRGEQHNERDQREAAEALGFGAERVRFIDQLEPRFERLPIRFFGMEEYRDRMRLAISRIVQDFAPNLVFVPSLHDTMQDHQAMSEEVVRVIRGPAAILGYEVPKHNRLFQPNVFVDVSDTNLEAKIRALNCYSEFTTRYYFEPDAIRALARVRALDAGYSGTAEAFELYRLFVG
jgi:LmbE family N-acetylglucosaminyl deacetylase